MGAPASQTVTQDVDPQFRNRLMALYGDAQDYLRQTQYEPYGGPLVANLDPMERAAQSYLTQNILGTSVPYQAPQRFGPFQGVPFDPSNPPPVNYDPRDPRDPNDPTVEPPVDDSSNDNFDNDLDPNYDPDVHGPLRMAALQASPSDPFGSGPMPGSPIGSAQNQYASDVAMGLTGYNPMMVTPGTAQGYGDVGAQNVAAQTGAMGMGAYTNPYQQEVIGGALQDMGRAEAMFREGGIYSKGAGTFGGDRQGVQVAEANRDFADRAGRLSAQLRSQGFNTAAGLAQTDANRMLSAGLGNQGANLQASLANQGQFNDLSRFNTGLGMQGQLANQGAGLQGAGLNLNAAGALNQFGNDAFGNMLRGAGALAGMGQGNRSLSQQFINSDIGQFDEARNAGLRDIGVLQSILSGMPVGMSSTTTVQPNTASSIGGGLLGLLGGGLSGGLFNSLFQ